LVAVATYYSSTWTTSGSEWPCPFCCELEERRIHCWPCSYVEYCPEEFGISWDLKSKWVVKSLEE